jgi:hypothetical protein
VVYLRQFFTLSVSSVKSFRIATSAGKRRTPMNAPPHSIFICTQGATLFALKVAGAERWQQLAVRFWDRKPMANQANLRCPEVKLT